MLKKMQGGKDLKIVKVKLTEKIKQIYFLQLLKDLQSEDINCEIKLDENALNVKYPHFLSTYDFDGVDINELFSFIQWNDRGGRENFHLRFDTIEYLYCFGNESILLADSDLQWYQFPKFFDSLKESVKNDLVAMFSLGSVYIFNKVGTFLDLSEDPNLYDFGSVRVFFIDETYFVIESYDDNNGTSCTLYNYSNGMIIRDLISTKELLQLLDKEGIEWGLDNLSNVLIADKEIVMMAFNDYSSNFNRIDFGSLPTHLKEDRDIAKAAIKSSCYNYSKLPVVFQMDNEIARMALKKCPDLTRDLPKGLLTNKEFWFSFLKDTIKDHLNLQGITEGMTLEECLSVKSIALTLIRENRHIAPLISEDLKCDKDIIFEAVKANYLSVVDFPIVLEDEALAFEVISAYSETLSQLKKYSADKDFANKLLRLKGDSLKYFDEAVRNDKNLVLIACSQNINAIQYVGKDLLTDDDIQRLKQEYDKSDDLPF